MRPNGTILEQLPDGTCRERLPDGTINNCALANNVSERECQVCLEACPNRARHVLNERDWRSLGLLRDDPTPRHNPGMTDKPLRSRSEAKKAREAATSTRVDEPPKASEIDFEKKEEDELPKKTSYNFPDANKPREHGIRPDLERVVEEVFLVDIHAEWKKLEKALELGEKRSEHGHAIAALDKAATNAYRAHRLYLTARSAREEWEAENEVIFGAMVTRANHDLQQEKEAGTRSKQITDADVKARVATLFPDEWRAQETKRRNVELTVKSLERLAELWFGRCKDLQAMVGKLR